MTTLEEERDDTDDPLRTLAARDVHFRPDDPPQVREALMQEAVRRDRAFFRDGLEHMGVSDGTR